MVNAAIAKATGEKPLFAVDEFDAGLAAGWVEALLAMLPEADFAGISVFGPVLRYLPMSIL